MLFDQFTAHLMLVEHFKLLEISQETVFHLVEAVSILSELNLKGLDFVDISLFDLRNEGIRALL